MVGFSYEAAALPGDIVYLIVQQVFGMTGARGARRGACRRLARMSNVLGVSAAWRRAAVPLVYSTLVCEMVDGRWHTNIALFAGGMSRWARELVVGHDALAAAVVLEQLGFSRIRWPRLNEVRAVPGAMGMHAACALVLRARQQDTIGRAQERMSAERHARGSIQGHALVQGHGAIRRPSVGHRSRLAGAFKVQLPHMHVRDMAVGWSAHALALIVRAAATLEHLRVIDIPRARARDVLHLANFVFPAVRTLVLQFAEGSGNAVSDASVLRGGISKGAGFPRLQRLRVCDVPFDVRECVLALGRRASRIEVEVSAELAGAARLHAWDARGLCATTVDVACVGPACIGAERAARLVRQIVRTTPAQTQHLRVGVRAEHALARSALDRVPLRCTELQTLDLRVPVRLADCATLMARLPQLWSLRVPSVCTDEMPPGEVRSLDKLYAVLGARGAPLPISTSLQRMHVGFWDYRQPARTLCCHVIHFAAALPNLMQVSTEPQFALALRSAVDGLHMMHRRQARWASQSNTDFAWLDQLSILNIS
ncbi:hypothetical protein GGF43_003024 [Coemansia sp. RSA 2618]|nr:hypothetical protein GGF43_003024 [Coemansia sp. RSA 2618]